MAIPTAVTMSSTRVKGMPMTMMVRSTASPAMASEPSRPVRPQRSGSRRISDSSCFIGLGANMRKTKPSAK